MFCPSVTGSSMISPETSGEMAMTSSGSIFPVAVTMCVTFFLNAFSVVISTGFLPLRSHIARGMVLRSSRVMAIHFLLPVVFLRLSFIVEGAGSCSCCRGSVAGRVVEYVALQNEVEGGLRECGAGVEERGPGVAEFDEAGGAEVVFALDGGEGGFGGFDSGCGDVALGYGGAVFGGGFVKVGQNGAAEVFEVELALHGVDACFGYGGVALKAVKNGPAELE